MDEGKSSCWEAVVQLYLFIINTRDERVFLSLYRYIVPIVNFIEAFAKPKLTIGTIKRYNDKIMAKTIAKASTIIALFTITF